MTNIFKYLKNKNKIKKVKITLNHALLIRDLKIKINNDQCFDLFGDINKQWKTLYSDTLISLQIYQVLINNEQTFSQFIKKYEGIAPHIIADQIVRALINFFSLPQPTIQKLKITAKIAKKQRELTMKKLNIIGKQFGA